MTRIYDLISKIRDFREGVDYSVSINNQEKTFTIHSRELQKSLRREISSFPLVESEWNTPITKMEQIKNERYIYQGEGGSSFDRLTILGNNSNSFGLLEGQNNPPQISEITNAEARQFEAQGVETVHSSFSPFSSTNRTNDYYRSENWTNNYQGDENREARQREFENRQKELKEQEERLAAERKKLEEEMKAQTQQSQQQNFQSVRQGRQDGGYIPPAASFWAVVIHVLGLAGVLL